MNEVLNVLCLEDSPRDAEIIREFLIDAGYVLNMDCTAAEKEFVSFLSNRRYDIILSDFKLPGFDGFGALRWTVEICPDVPFICVSGSIGESLAVEMLKKGAVDYVLKDRIERLPSAIQRALDEAKEKKARQQAEEKVREMKTLLQASIESPKDMIVLSIDKHYQYLTFNMFHKDVMKQAYGKVIMYGMNLLECITNVDDRKKAKVNYDRALAGESHTTIEEYGDLNRYYYETRYNPIINDRNEIIGATAFSANITERKQAEKALLESERKLREAQEMAHLGFWHWDVKTGDVEWSEEVYKIFCLNPEEFTPHIDSILSLSPWPEDHQRDKELINKAIETHSPGSYVQKFLRPDQSIGHYYSTFQGKYDETGNLASIVGTVLDITERKLVEEKLSLLASRQDAILSAVPDIIMEVDNSKKYTWANKSGIEFFGDDVIGKEADFYFEGGQETYQLVQPLFNGEENTIYIESWQRRRDGEIRLLSWYCWVLKDQNGIVMGALSSALDITERKQAEEKIKILNELLEQRIIERTSQLEAANKELEAFAYSVSHDLRAPLRAVDGFSKFILEDYKDKLDSEGKRFLNLIRSNIQKMDQLITDLLALSRVARNDMNFSGIDMTQMAISMLHETAQPDVSDKISLKVDPLPEAYADPTYIRQVWANLIANAIKFSSKEKKPTIKICGHAENGFNIYYVKDNGVGFNPEYAHKLFGVFQRLHKSDDFEGTGVGLAIVQRIIRRHGGEVWAEGEEGKGATFWFSLPVKS
jgi:PAS domain S-box-containing protein